MIGAIRHQHRSQMQLENGFWRAVSEHPHDYIGTARVEAWNAKIANPGNAVRVITEQVTIIGIEEIK